MRKFPFLEVSHPIDTDKEHFQNDSRENHFMTLGCLTLLIVPVVIAAQPDGLTLTEGKVYINDRAVSASASSSPVGIDSSSLIRTEIGRAKVELHDGRSVFLNTNSTVRIVGDRLEIVAGSVVISSHDVGGEVTCQNSVRLSGQGRFRFTVEPEPDPTNTQCRLNVAGGSATVQLVTAVQVLRTGHTMSLHRRCGDMIPHGTFDSTNIDEFDRWVDRLNSGNR